MVTVMKIGIVGGTFNPIHLGHLMLGEYAYETYGLDEIWFLPNGNPPHKNLLEISTETNDRIAMVNLAIANTPYFKLNEYEMNREEVSYSYETMNYFSKEYPNHEFYFIIGTDSLFQLDKWRHPERLLKLCTILVACRTNITLESILEKIRDLKLKFHAKIELLEMPIMEVASSDIRSRIIEGKSIKYIVPDVVGQYIIKNNLYKTNTIEQTGEKPAMELIEIQNELREKLNPRRYEHTLGVMYTAAALAMQEKVDIESAMLAGLLHDCAKCIPYETQYKLCEEYQIELTTIEKENPALIHAKLGASLAKHVYGIDNPEILEAIRYHTTGRPKMTPLEKILYLADAIEPGRKYKHLKKIRYLAFHNIDESLYELLAGSVWYLQSINRAVDELTQKTFEYYKSKHHKSRHYKSKRRDINNERHKHSKRNG